MRLLAIVPHALGFAPGQRLRVESWAVDLRLRGVTTDFAPFESERLKSVLHAHGRVGSKAALLASDWIRQCLRVSRARDYDAAVIHREAALIGPALIERIPALRGMPIVYDIDDPVFVPYRSPENTWATPLKFHRKTKGLIARSRVVSAINDRIGAYARQFNDHVTVVPNFIDCSLYRPRAHEKRLGSARLLWIGSQSTVANLEALIPVFTRLSDTLPLTLVVVGPRGVHVPGIDVEAHEWSPSAEAEVAATCDIGVVPVMPSPWADWKFYFKTLQYMAAGLPVVAEAVGSNVDLVEAHRCGRAVSGVDAWAAALTEFIDDDDLRREAGGRGRAAAESHFDVSFRGDAVYDLIAAALR